MDKKYVQIFRINRQTILYHSESGLKFNAILLEKVKSTDELESFKSLEFNIKIY